MGTLTEIYVLDLIGTFAFAVHGAYVAMTKKVDFVAQMSIDECD
jgi:uncharacterized membrane protein YeiH